MKNLFKKISSILIAAVMVLAMASTAFATSGNLTEKKPTAKDTGEVTISGLASGDKVTLYKIVEAQYNNDGFYGYKAVTGVTIADTTTFVPSASEIETLAAQKLKSVKVATDIVVKGESVTISNLEIGSYLVKVTAGNGEVTVYNPMVVSVAYVAEGNDTKILYGNVSANDSYEISKETVYAKSSKESKPDKNIVDATGNPIVNGVAAGKGDAVAEGDTVNYKITGMIPEYNSKFYSNATYTINDEVSSGLDLAENTKENLQAQADAKYGKGNVTVSVTGKNITIDFKKSFLVDLDEALRSYSFTYSAVLNGTSVNFDARTNTVKVNYSNTPSTTTDSDGVTTYHYTFAFNGDVTKVDENKKALEGAVFGLFTDEKCNNPANREGTDKQITATSELKGNNAEINFTGLDDTVYYMKEIATPSAEYKLNNTVYKVEFKPTFDTVGKMTQYTVTVKDMTTNIEKTNTYVAGNDNTAEIDGNKDVTVIQNTKLGALPSTGGMGTYLFTIIGVVVMAGAAGAFFISRRKGSEE